MAIFEGVGTNDSGRNNQFFIRSDRLEVPDGLYFVGREVTITYLQGLSRSSFTATFAGYEEGTNYPIFYFDTARYRGITQRGGSIIGFSTSQTANTNYNVDDDDFVTNRLIGIGVDTPDYLESVTFADFGLRRPAGEETDELTSQNRMVRVDSGVYTVGQRVTLSVLNPDGTSVSFTIETEFAGTDPDTGDPFFNPVDPDGDGPLSIYRDGRQILLPGEKTSLYTVPQSDIVAETLGIGVPTPGITASFADYGLRDGTTDTYNSQGREIVIEKGAYQAGDSVRAWIVLARDGNGDVSHVEHAFEATVVGHEAGTGNLLLDPPSDALSGTRIVVAGDKAATYTVDDDGADFVTDAPLGVGFTYFPDYGLRVPNQNTYNSQDRGIEVENGTHNVGDMVEIRIVDRTGGIARKVDNTFEATFRGYDSATSGPIFEPPSDFRSGRWIFGVSGDTQSVYTVTDLVVEAWPPAPEPVDATFANYGFRQGDDITNNVAFDLQGTGPSFGLVIPDGVYAVGGTLTIQLFGGTAGGSTVDVTYVGHVVSSDGTNYPIFEAANFNGQRAQFIGTRETGSGDYTPGQLVTNTPYATGVATFADYGLRRPSGAVDEFTSQNLEIEFDYDLLTVGKTVDLRIFRVSGDERTLENTITAEFAGYDGETGYPLFNNPRLQNGDVYRNGRQIIAANVKETIYDVPMADVVAEDWPPEVTFTSYGFRQGATVGDLDDDFALQHGPGAGVHVPPGAYRPGDTLTIQIFGGGAASGSVDVTYIGRTSNPDGHAYPVFQHDDFNGAGPAQFIGINEPDATATYDPGTVDAGTPYAIGVATFPDYGLRRPSGEVDEFTSQNLLIEFDYDVYNLNDMVELRLSRADGTGRFTVNAQFAGYDRETGDPLFSNPRLPNGDVYRNGRQIIAASEKATGSPAVYDVPQADIVAEAWPPQTDEPDEPDNPDEPDEPDNPDEPDQPDPPPSVNNEFDALFYNFNNVSGGNRYVRDFSNQVVEGDDAVISATDDAGNAQYTAGSSTTDIRIPFDGLNTGTFIGYEAGTFFPIFEVRALGGTFRVIALHGVGLRGGNGPNVYNVDPNNIITDMPLEIGPQATGFVRFDNVAIFQGAGPAGTYQYLGQTRDIRAGSYAVGDTEVGGETIRIPDQDNNPQAVEFVGYQTDTNYPIFKTVNQVNGEFINFLLTDEPSTATTYTLTTDEITTDAYTTCFAPGTLIATPHGERAVETLKPGDEVLTADGGVATVRFVGMQKVSTIFGPRELTHPVRILAGALGRNVPHTDLVVTKDHGMILDGVVCHAGALINGTSIIEVPTHELDTDPKGVVTYYHVETENHAVLLANGAVAESFIDHVDRAAFANHAEFVDMYGAEVPAMTEMNMPRAMSMRQLPNRIRWRLIERAEAIQAPVARSA